MYETKRADKHPIEKIDRQLNQNGRLTIITSSTRPIDRYGDNKTFLFFQIVLISHGLSGRHFSSPSLTFPLTFHDLRTYTRRLTQVKDQPYTWMELGSYCCSDEWLWHTAMIGLLIAPLDGIWNIKWFIIFFLNSKINFLLCFVCRFLRFSPIFLPPFTNPSELWTCKNRWTSGLFGSVVYLS